MRRPTSLRVVYRRLSAHPDVGEKVWNENYYLKVAEAEKARPRPEDRLARTKQMVKYYWDHTVHGLRAAWKDTKWLVAPGVSGQGPAGRLRQAVVRKEVLKFLPYSFFVIVPFAELLLPFYVWLLPNMTPYYFKTPGSLGRGEAVERDAQENAHQKLENYLRQHLRLDFSELRHALSAEDVRRADEKVISHLKSNWQSYEHALGAPGFDAELGLAALRFLRAPHLTGTYLLNELLNLHVMLMNLFFWVIRIPQRAQRLHYDFAFWPVEEWLSAFYRWQLKRHISALQQTDEGFDSSTLGQLDFFESWRLMAERGIFAPSRHNAEAQYTQLWRGQPLENPYIALWAQVIRRTYGSKIAS